MSERRDSDDLSDLMVHPESLEILERLSRIEADIEALESTRAHLRDLRKTIVRWVWEHEGWTVREASDVLGIPKSTLSRWATSADWRAGLRC